MQITDMQAWNDFAVSAAPEVVGFAVKWAEAMEAEIALDTRRDPTTIGNIARLTQQSAGRDSVSLNQYHQVINALGKCWLYGDALARGMK